MDHPSGFRPATSVVLFYKPFLISLSLSLSLSLSRALSLWLSRHVRPLVDDCCTVTINYTRAHDVTRCLPEKVVVVADAAANQNP
uniref:Putative secreted protein n=1 Tax=Anopheles darlingi TaxID=43151 RepID=A0A2M4D9X7_ANODA